MASKNNGVSRGILAATLALLVCVRTSPMVIPFPKNIGSPGTLQHSRVNTLGDDRIQRRLRVNPDDDERGLDGLKSLRAKLSKNPTNEDEVNQLFTKFNLFNEKVAVSEVFEDQLFSKLANKVTKGYKGNSAEAEMAIASVLTQKRGDDVLADMILAAKEKPTTKEIATKLEVAQVNNWLTKEATVDDVFQSLRIEEGMPNLLWDPRLSIWVSFVEKMNQDPYNLLFAKISVSSRSDILAGRLASAKRDAAVSTIAQKLENAQFDTWEAEKKTGEDIFKWFKLNEYGEDMFKYPQMSSLLSYMTKLDRQNAEEQLYMVLRSSYGEDTLAILLADSKKYDFGDVAKRLEEVQFEVWMAEGKTAMETFKALKLNNKDEKLFGSAAFTTWTQYVRNEASAHELMLSTLKKAYTDDVLAQMLAEAKKSTTTENLARNLEQEQMKEWAKSKQSADDVFMLLKLGDDMDNLLINPILSTWIAYAVKMNENPYEVLLTNLKSPRFFDVLTIAKNDASTSAIAEKLEALQLERWWSNGKSVDDVFKLLELKNIDHRLLWHVRVRLWVAYATKVDSKNADNAIASVLKSYWNDNQLAVVLEDGKNRGEEITKLMELVLAMWVKEGKSAGRVFDLVLLEHGVNVFKHHAIHTWVSYVTKLDPNNPYKTMLKVLQERFGGKKLAGMLSKAEWDPDVRSIAAQLKAEL